MGFDGSVRAKTHHGENSRNSLGANGNFLHGPPPLMFPPRLPPPPISQLNQNLSVPLQQQQQQQQQNIIEQQHLQAPYCGESLQMEVEEEKQKPEPTLSERLILLRKRDIGCDVNFVIGSEPNVKVIKAHRAVLASGSKAFEEMFFSNNAPSPVAKKRRTHNGLDEVLSIDVNDICYDAFFCLICFLYSDFKINLGDIPESAILDTVYAARKYTVPQLETLCVKLLGDLSPSRAISLLEQAQKFGSTELLDRCFEIIDNRTDEALSSDSFLLLKKQTIQMVLERSELTPSDELIVYRATLAWAEAECNRQCIAETDSNKRKVLGDVFNEIRFPTMTIEEFGEVANGNILTDNEIGILFRYLSSTVRSTLKLPFVTTERRCSGRSKLVVKRFMMLSKNTWKKQRNSIWFIVNREILVSALGIYGIISNEKNPEGAEWETTVEIELSCSQSNNIMKEEAQVIAHGTYGDPRVIPLRFKRPVRVLPYIPYKASVAFQEEVETYAGGNGAEDVRLPVGISGTSTEQISGSASPAPVADSASVHFAFHNDDPFGIRRGMTRGPAVFANAIGGFYNRPASRAPPLISEGCLYEGQLPEIYFSISNAIKKEVKDN